MPVIEYAAKGESSMRTRARPVRGARRHCCVGCQAAGDSGVANGRRQRCGQRESDPLSQAYVSTLVPRRKGSGGLMNTDEKLPSRAVTSYLSQQHPTYVILRTKQPFLVFKRVCPPPAPSKEALLCPTHVKTHTDRRKATNHRTKAPAQ